jgi:hypothetical protein
MAESLGQRRGGWWAGRVRGSDSEVAHALDEIVLVGVLGDDDMGAPARAAAVAVDGLCGQCVASPRGMP